jgi:pyruvate dehydrogenase E2 component (dihydrolipoamide acetyltransferase)
VLNAGDGEDVKAAAQRRRRLRTGPSLPRHRSPPKQRSRLLRPLRPAGRCTAPQPAAAPAAQANGTPASSRRRWRAARQGSRHIELARIAGSGPHGRVVARDVEEAKSGKGLKAPAAAPAGPARASRRRCRTSRPLALYEPGSYERAAQTACASTIAQRLTASVQTIPHFYLTIDCDIGKLLAAREEINAQRRRTRRRSRSTSSRSTTSSSRRWRSRCSKMPELQRELDRKAACSSTSIPTSASRWRCRAG